MRARIGAAILIVAVTGGPVAGCRRAEPAAEAEQPIGVSVQTARRQSIRDAATASGLVVPAAAGEWTIYAPSAAQIARLPLKENDPVAAGDVLVQFDIASVTQQLSIRQAAVTEASARADRAKAEFTRMSGLFERGIASRNAYEAARTEQTTSASVLTQAVADLEATKIENSQATVRARFAGVVAKVYHGEGRVRERLGHRSDSAGHRSHAAAGRGAVSDPSARAHRAGTGRHDPGHRRRGTAAGDRRVQTRQRGCERTDRRSQARVRRTGHAHRRTPPSVSRSCSINEQTPSSCRRLPCSATTCRRSS